MLEISDLQRLGLRCIEAIYVRNKLWHTVLWLDVEWIRVIHCKQRDLLLWLAVFQIQIDETLA